MRGWRSKDGVGGGGEAGGPVLSEGERRETVGGPKSEEARGRLAWMKSLLFHFTSKLKEFKEPICISMNLPPPPTHTHRHTHTPLVSSANKAGPLSSTLHCNRRRPSTPVEPLSMERLTNVGKWCHVTTPNIKDANVNVSRRLAQAQAVNYSRPTTTICFDFKLF